MYSCSVIFGGIFEFWRDLSDQSQYINFGGKLEGFG